MRRGLLLDIFWSDCFLQPLHTFGMQDYVFNTEAHPLRIMTRGYSVSAKEIGDAVTPQRDMTKVEMEALWSRAAVMDSKMAEKKQGQRTER